MLDLGQCCLPLAKSSLIEIAPVAG